MAVLPPEIELSATAVAGMNIDGADRFSARDLSFALSVIYLALHGHPEDDDGEVYRLPDNRLRAALGMTRRENLDKEAARFIRLRDSTVRVDDGPRLPLPTTLFRMRGGSSEPVIHNMDDQVGWVVHPGLLEAFRPSESDRVRIPTALLANASTRLGLELGCRLLAMHALGPASPRTIKWDSEFFTAVLPYADAVRVLRLPNVVPSVLNDKFLKPAFRDGWDAAGIVVDVELRRSGSAARPVGRVRDVAIFMRRPAASPIAERVRAIEEERVGSWQTPPKSKRSRPVPPDNVIAFQPKPVTMRRVPFGKPRSAAQDADGRDI
jgi:hypothetical protein